LKKVLDLGCYCALQQYRVSNSNKINKWKNTRRRKKCDIRSFSTLTQGGEKKDSVSIFY
jgi:transcriptional regulator NrdR family protein